MSAFDVIVIGAGHNGLTTATTLARAGRSVLVVEARDTVGGLAGAHAFGDGHALRILQDTRGVRSSVVRDLELEKHGLRMRETAPDVLALGAPGESLVLHGEREAAVRALAARSQHDAHSYAALLDFSARTRAALRTFLDEPPVDVLDVQSAGSLDLLRRALRVRTVGRRDLLELLRQPPMSVADALDERFELDLLKAALALPIVSFDFTGPRSPGTQASFLFDLAAAGPGVVGGGPALIAALESAATAAGATIRCAARVERIRVDGRVRGVRLTDGEEIDAPVVAASCHPAATFLSLMPPRSMPFRLLHRIQRFRTRGTAAVVAFAMRGRPRFTTQPDADIEFVRIGADLNALERAFDAVKYERLPEQPALQIHLSEDGNSGTVLSVLVHAVPYTLVGGWTEARREQLADRVQESVAAHCIDFDVASRALWAPPDLDDRFALPQGNLRHGEHALDQILVRPVPECSRYATPIAGLFLCGSGSHPGGGITCAPGALAARAIRAHT